MIILEKDYVKVNKVIFESLFNMAEPIISSANRFGYSIRPSITQYSVGLIDRHKIAETE